MKKVIVISDSFKGTLSSREIGTLAGEVIRRHYPDCRVIALAAADGGEGTAECFLSALPGERRTVSVSGPWGEKVEAAYAAFGSAAVIETAAAAGLPLVGERKDPSLTTTYGVGELLKLLSASGCRRVLMGIGGSATNDCGVGMAAALGYRFMDEKGGEVEPFACNIGSIRRIVRPDALPALSITVACDVDNPLCGEHGASAVFGPQKGLLPQQIGPLDRDIRAFAALIKTELGADVLEVPGAGAAGGLGAALLAFCGAELKPGIELLLDAAGMDELLKDTELVITVEGRIDGQSAAGKVPVGVGRRAKKAGVPCVAVCGCIGPGAEAVLHEGVTAYYAASDGTKTMDEIRKTCREDLRNTAVGVIKEYV